jgi:mono/diheme cytochrome c family protein/glucose/arabinose dehydrogenase
VKRLKTIFIAHLAAAAIFARTAIAPAKNPNNAGPEDPPIKFKLPPPPPLAPDEALKTFKLPNGFEIQLVAAEPLVEDPIAVSFDADGRIWVVEMRGYMHDIEGKGEDQPLGRIKILSDTDGDGRMDKATVFLDGLFMPRGVMVWRDGAIVAEPPNLVFWRDSDGDGKADEKTIIAANYGSKGGQPEHMANCPTFALDNWIYSAAYAQRFKMVGGKWVTETTRARGQWGISQDDFGRLYYNYNSDFLRADLVPGHYLWRNPNFAATTGVNVKLIADQSVWPSHATPGVNRGYGIGTLRDDGTLKNCTATCGPGVYRADLFPKEFLGNVFIPEPSANLVKRVIVSESDGILTAANAYKNSEFLTSTDERFRPVNCYTGPDGALYIVDLYRGVLQHKAFLTNYLIKNIAERKLESPINLGRIWKVIPKGVVPVPVKVRADPAFLSHPNGWVRDTAQRMMVEKPDAKLIRPLEKLAAISPNPIARLHALRTLEGMARLEMSTAISALHDPDSKIRATAIRLCEPFLIPATRPEVLPEILKLTDDPTFDVHLQLAFTLSPIPEAEDALAKILEKDSSKILIREAAISGLRGRELEFLQKFRPKSLLLTLSQCVMNERRPNRIKRLLDFAAEQEKPARTAILDGMANAKSRAAPGKLILLDEKPDSLESLLKTDPTLATKISDRLGWPNKPGVIIPPPPRPLTALEQSHFDQGKIIYTNVCAACHQPTGLGQDGLAPPLLDSEYVLGPPARLPRILMHGVTGPITVTGVPFRLEMPALPDLNDDQIAAVLTYIRREWDHEADPIEPALVNKIRTQESNRREPWTAQELLKIK